MHLPNPITSNYISSTEAAARYGMTNDHIASLCRRNKVVGHLSGGRVWFVDEEALKAYKARTQDEKKARRHELSRQSKRAYLVTPEEEQMSFWHIAGPISVLGSILFIIVGAFYIFVAPVYKSLAEVPWEYMPAAVAETSADFYDATFMATAEQFVLAVDVVGDMQAESYRTLGFGTGVVAGAMVSGYADMMQWYAHRFVGAVYAFGDGQVYVYDAIATTMQESSDTIGTSFANALLGAGAYMDNLSLWYVDSSATITTRLDGQMHTASVWDSWTQWLTEVLYTPDTAPHPAEDVPAPPMPASPPALSSNTTSTIYVVQPSEVSAPVRMVQGVTQTDLTSQIQKLSNELKTLIYTQAGTPGPTFLGGGFSNALALTQRIDKLDGVTITNSTISGYLSSSATIGVSQGGTGLSTAPTYGKVLLGNALGEYDLVATSSLGITVGSSYTFSYPLVDSANIISLAFGTTTQNNFLLHNIFTSLFATNASTTNATTTSFAISNIASGSLLKTTAGGALLAAIAGTDYANFAWPFTPATNFGANTNSTTTSIWLRAGLQASSTSQFDAGIFRTGLSVGSTSPFAYFSIHAASTTATTTLFAISSTTSAGVVSNLFSIFNTGSVGIASSTPSPLFKLNVGGSAYVGSGTASTFTIHAGTINYPIVSTTTISNSPNAWSIATSTAAGSGPVVSISGSGATSTISFFGATTTGLSAGGGLGLPSTLQNMFIIGNGVTSAGVAIIKGGLCVDGDGWCTASTTGNVAALTFQTAAASDLAEMYASYDTLVPGEIVAATGESALGRASGTSTIVGIVSTQPGIVLAAEMALTSFLNPSLNYYPIALAGRVPVKVNLEGGPIAVGDTITLSTTPGVGRKATPFDETTVGVALQSYAATSTGGSVEVFIKVEHRSGADALTDMLLGTSTDAQSPAKSFFLDTLFKKIITWFADAANGIGSFFAERVHTKELCVAKSDGTEICITGDQLSAMLSGQSTAVILSPNTPPAAPVEPPPEPEPVLEIEPEPQLAPL